MRVHQHYKSLSERLKRRIGTPTPLLALAKGLATDPARDDNRAARPCLWRRRDRPRGRGRAGRGQPDDRAAHRDRQRGEAAACAPVTTLNFTISVGAKVPRAVKYHPLPAAVVEICPEWRGYYFILVRDEIVIIRPNTFEIVAVIPA
jgi:hypothetical protein